MLSFLIAASLLGAQAWILYDAWPELPSQVAVHWGMGGPDGWGNRESLVWMSGLVSAVVMACFHLPAAFVNRIPTSLMNIPHKEYWLGPERSAQTIKTLRRSMFRAGNLSLAASLLLTSAVLNANLQPEQSLSRWFVPGVFLYVVGILVWAIALKVRFDRPVTV